MADNERSAILLKLTKAVNDLQGKGSEADVVARLKKDGLRDSELEFARKRLKADKALQRLLKGEGRLQIVVDKANQFLEKSDFDMLQDFLKRQKSLKGAKIKVKKMSGQFGAPDFRLDVIKDGERYMTFDATKDGFIFHAIVRDPRIGYTSISTTKGYRSMLLSLRSLIQ
jgi:hypothetical protein